MSRPRTPYGPNPPGRLAATMIKVLAAELSDQGRLARGKRYWADAAVVDIVIGHGAVTAEVQGSRPAPYVVTLEAGRGEGVPTKRELWVSCTCPDDSGTGSEACKHAVAALFALSDEIAIEPDLIARWRRSGQAAAPDGDRDARSAEQPERPSGHSSGQPSGQPSDQPSDHSSDHSSDQPSDRPVDELAERRARSQPRGRPGRPGEVIELHTRGEHPPDPDVAQLAALVAAPAGVSAPDLPEPTPIEHRDVRDRALAEVLADALEHLALRWD